MKRWLLLFLAIFAGLTSTGQPKTQLLSPDKTIRIEIQAIDRLSYRVYADDRIILDESLIDMKLADGRSLSGRMKIAKAETRSIHTTILAQIPVSRKYIPDEFNELTLQFNNRFAIIFRAYNDGVAYRIRTTFRDSVVIKSETAVFHFAPGGHCYAPVVQKREGLDVFHTSFEELYPYRKLDSLSDKDFMYSPVLVKTATDVFVALTESDLDDYPGMFLHGTSGNELHGAFAAYPLEEKIAEGEYPEMVVSKRADYLAKTKGTRNFPCG